MVFSVLVVYDHFWGVLSLKNILILTFDVYPSQDRGYPRGPRGVSDQNVALNKKWPAPGFRWSQLWNMLKLLNFGRPLSSPAFRPHFFRAVGQKSKFRSPTFCLPHCLDSKKVWHDPLLQYPGRIYIWQKPPFWGGVRAWSPVLRVRIYPPKNYFCRVTWALIILPRWVQRVKSYGTFLQWPPDTQTHKKESLHYHHRIFLRICEGDGGNTMNPTSVEFPKYSTHSLRWVQ